MADVVRLDRGLIQAKSGPRLIEGTVARVHGAGDALEYVSGPEYRDIEELRRFVDQLPGLRVVTYAVPDMDNPLGHPAGLLADGVEFHEIGVVLSGLIRDGQAVASIYIHDKGALEAIEDGTRELSLGYRCTLDEGRYQRNVMLDHLSVVEGARCGPVCALRSDAKTDQACGCVAKIAANATTLAVATTTLANVKVTLDDESKELLQAWTTASTLVTDAHTDCECKKSVIEHSNGETNMDELQKKLDEALATVAKLEGELAAARADSAKADDTSKLTKLELALSQAVLDLKAETARATQLATEIETVKTDAQASVDAATKARNDAEQTEFRAAVDARVELLSDAGKVGIEDASTKTDREIMVAIVKKVDEMDVEDDRTAEYVNGMYAGAMKRHVRAAASVAEVRTTIVENRDSAEKTEDPYKAEAELAAAAEAKRKNRWR